MYEKLATKFIAVDTMVPSSCEIVSKTLHDFDRQKYIDKNKPNRNF